MRRLTITLALALLTALIPGSAAAVPTQRSLPADPQEVREFWTAERMAAAVPASPAAGATEAEAPTAMRGGYLSEPVPSPGSAPYPATGKVFFRLGGVSYFCSAAITDAPSKNLVWTAAHCVRDPGRRGKWARKWVFVPGYADGTRPFGSWPARSLWIDPAWAHRNDNADFAAAVLRKRGGVHVQNAVGQAYPLATNPPRRQRWEAIGYPAGAQFGDRLWHCRSSFRRTDRRGPNRPGPEPFGIGCDMTGGSSGGPWLTQAGKIGAVTSYGYLSRPNLLFGTYLGGWARKLYRRVKNR